MKLCSGSMAASLDSVRRNKVAMLHLLTDACTTVGGGAWVLLPNSIVPLDGYNEAGLRWTKHELQMFESMNVSINVLEYYVVMYYVMLWGENFRNKVIHVKCDNSSAMSWIVKSRDANSSAADALAKLFSLYCLHMNIIICTHIPGVENIIADFRSRDLFFS